MHTTVGYNALENSLYITFPLRNCSKNWPRMNQYHIILLSTLQNLPKSYLESNNQWGNRSVPSERIGSQTQNGQLQPAAASPGVLRGETGEMSCTVHNLHNWFFFYKRMHAIWILATPLHNIHERVMLQYICRSRSEWSDQWPLAACSFDVAC